MAGAEIRPLSLHGPLQRLGDFIALADANQRVNLRHFFLERIAVALRKAAGDDEL